MDVRRITPDFAVAPQIAVDDVAAIAAAGFRSLICNRPDDEDPGQPRYAAIAAAAEAAGLEVRFQPVAPSGVSVADGVELARLYVELPKPVLAYCRSGTRCAILWGIAQDCGGAAG